MDKLLKHESEVRSEAKQILDDILLPLLKKYGSVEVGGSYLYKLMYQRDIDLILISENIDRAQYTDLCKEILSLDCVSKFSTTDRVKFPHKFGNDRPTGYWLSPLIKFNENEWIVDIWLQKSEWVDGNNSKYEDSLKELTDEQRTQVLGIKKALKEEGRYGVGKEFLSVDVYESVLRNQSLEELRSHFGLN